MNQELENLAAAAAPAILVVLWSTGNREWGLQIK
jgi:hypothetical protein